MPNYHDVVGAMARRVAVGGRLAWLRTRRAALLHETPVNRALVYAFDDVIAREIERAGGHYVQDWPRPADAPPIDTVPIDPPPVLPAPVVEFGGNDPSPPLFLDNELTDRANKTVQQSYFAVGRLRRRRRHEGFPR